MVLQGGHRWLVAGWSEGVGTQFVSRARANSVRAKSAMRSLWGGSPRAQAHLGKERHGDWRKLA